MAVHIFDGPEHCYRCGTPFLRTDEQIDTWGVMFSPDRLFCPGCTTDLEHIEMEIREAFDEA